MIEKRCQTRSWLVSRCFPIVLADRQPGTSYYHIKGFNFPEWRPNFLTSEMSVALMKVTIINLLASQLTVFFDVLVILAVKTTPQLLNKYHALLAWTALIENQSDCRIRYHAL